jgi:Tol biopolymer transport system component
MKKYIYGLFFIVFAIAISGCFNKDIEHEDGFGNFDVSSDGKLIAYSWITNGQASLYIYDINKNYIIKKISSPSEASFLNPRFSADGKNVVFVSNEKNSINSSIYVGNVISGEIKKITDTNSIKTEAVFNLGGDSIVYCAANEYGNNSIVAAKTARDFDIYSVSISSGLTKRYTNLNAYSLGSLNVDSASNVAFYVFAGDNGGIFKYNPMDGRMSKRIYSLNDTSDKAEDYSNPYFINSSHILYTVYNRMYVIDLSSQKTKSIFSFNSNISNLRYSSTLQRIFFTDESGDGTIYSIDIAGKEKHELKLIPHSSL